MHDKLRVDDESGISSTYNSISKNMSSLFFLLLPFFFSLPLISCHDVLLGLHSKEMEVSCFDMVTWWCSTHEIKTLSIRMQKSNGDCLHPLS